MNIRFTEAAIDDLDKIWLHGLDAFGLDKADQFTDGLRDRIAMLSDFPELGQVIAEAPYTIRRLVYEETVVVLYRVGADLVSIERIADGRRDIADLARSLP